MRRSLRRLAGPLPALLAVTAVALALRLWALGWRVAHWDEARVAGWALHYLRAGTFEYNPWIHGPFLPTVNRAFFVALGPSDFSMRLIVALVSGLLPLSAWLLRDRLRDAELVALGVLLALNPLVLYYSRFMRNDVLLAAFMLAAFFFYVRAVDTGATRHFYAGTALFALGFTTKEFALLYPLCWGGAALLLLDHRLTLRREAGDSAGAAAREYARWVLATAWRWRVPLLVGLVEFFVIVVYFYAPRSPGVEGVGLWKAVADPTMMPAVVEEATVGSWQKFVGAWGSSGDNAYLPYFRDFAHVMAGTAAALLILAGVGFVLDRYGGRRPRDVVAFTSYWGIASLLGYPLAADNPFPWEPVHIVVPLAVPAAVGLGYVVREGVEAFERERGTQVAGAVLLVLLVVGTMGATAYETSFERPQGPDNRLVQYVQPESELQPTLAEVRALAQTNEGVDVLYYGDVFHVEDETWGPGEDPPGEWFTRLPMAWYFAAYEATVSSTTDAGNATNTSAPVVVAPAPDFPEASGSADDVRERLLERGYEARDFYLYQQNDHEVVFFVRNETAAAG